MQPNEDHRFCRTSPSGDELHVLARIDYDALIERAIAGGAEPADVSARAQILSAGDDIELAVLSRRDHDVLLAWSGDEDAEDRLLAEKAREVRARIERGEEDWVPMSPERLRRAEAAYNAKRSEQQ